MVEFWSGGGILDFGDEVRFWEVEFLLLGGGIRDLGGTLFKNSTHKMRFWVVDFCSGRWNFYLGGGNFIWGVEFKFGGWNFNLGGGIFIWEVESGGGILGGGIVPNTVQESRK